MTVLYWQILIIGSVAISYMLNGRTTAFWVSVGWSIWTVYALFYLPLILLQLASNWGTYLGCRKIAELIPGFKRASSLRIDRTKDGLASPGLLTGRLGAAVFSLGGAVVGIATTFAGVSAGSAGGTAGATAMTSGLAALGGIVRGGMFAGLVVMAVAPMVGGAIGYGIYKLYEHRASQK